MSVGRDAVLSPTTNTGASVALGVNECEFLQGPQGFQGNPGETGEPGSAVSISSSRKHINMMWVSSLQLPMKRKCECLTSLKSCLLMLMLESSA